MKKKAYIDGANVAYDGTGKISVSRIKSVIDGLKKYGLEAHVILPSYMLNGKDSRKKVDRPEFIQKLMESGKLDLIQNDDDIALITAAYEMKCFILSNDKFGNYKQKYWCTPEIREWIEESRISYEIIEGNLVIPADSLCKIKRLLQAEKSVQNIYQNDLKEVSSGAYTETSDKGSDLITEKIVDIVRKTSKNTSFAMLGSEIKKETGRTMTQQFGNAKKFAQFLAERGFKVSYTNNEYFFEGAIG